MQNRKALSLDFEKLEDRRVLAATIYVDFGIGLAGQDGLNISDTTSAALNGPQVFGADYLITTLDQQLIDSAFTNEQRQAFYEVFLDKVRFHFEPFDVSVQQVNESNLAGIDAILQSTSTNDAYIFVGGMIPGSVERDAGIALFDMGNTEDNLGFVFSGYEILSPALHEQSKGIAAHVAKQAAHTFGARSIEITDSGSDGSLMAMTTDSQRKRCLSFHLGNHSAFLRRDLSRAYELGVSPGMENTFDVLAGNLGNNPNGIEYVTANGGQAGVPEIATLTVTAPNTVNFVMDGVNLSGLDISNGLQIQTPYRQRSNISLVAEGDSFDIIADDAIVELANNISLRSSPGDRFRHVNIFTDVFDDTIRNYGSRGIVIDSGGGNDTIFVDYRNTGQPIVANAGDGDDRIVVINPTPDPGIFISISGDAGFDTLDHSLSSSTSLGLSDVDENGFDFLFDIQGLDDSTFVRYLDFESVLGSTSADVDIRLSRISRFFTDGPPATPGVVFDEVVTVVDGDTATFTSKDGHSMTTTNLAGVYGQDISVISTTRNMNLVGDNVLVAANLDYQLGRSELIEHDLTIEAKEIVFSNIKGAGLNVTSANGENGGRPIITGLTGGSVTLFFNAKPTHLIIHGSESEADRVVYWDDRRISVYGYGGDDGFEYTWRSGGQFYGGDGSDYLILDNQATTRDLVYELDESGIRDVTFPSNPISLGTTDVEIVVLNATEGKNIFRVDPSPNTIFRVNGKSPGAGDGDSLALIGDASPVRYHVTQAGQGNGVWYFGDAPGADNLVIFEGIEFVAQSDRMAVGSRPGTAPLVSVYNPTTNEHLFNIRPYESGFRGGVQVATVDLNEDAIPDIVVAPGPSRYSRIMLYDGRNGAELGSFFAFPADRPLFANNFTGGVDIAVANVFQGTVNEFEWKIVASTLSGSDVRVFAQNSPLNFVLENSFNPFPGNPPRGVHVTAGDFDGNGTDEIVSTPADGNAPYIAIHRLTGDLQPGLVHRFSGYVPGYLGGFSAATGDMNGDGIDELLLSGIQTGSANDPFSGQYRVFDGSSLPGNSPSEQILPISTVQPFLRDFTRGVSVTARDVDLDGIVDFVFATRLDDGNGGRMIVHDANGNYVEHFQIQDEAFARGIGIA